MLMALGFRVGPGVLRAGDLSNRAGTRRGTPGRRGPGRATVRRFRRVRPGAVGWRGGRDSPGGAQSRARLIRGPRQRAGSASPKIIRTWVARVSRRNGLLRKAVASSWRASHEASGPG